jgi:RimJ/RimL family protein N-acetyltransferase
MLRSEHVTLRALEREDLPRIWQFNNDLAVELAGGGDPPLPQALERLAADFEKSVGTGGRDEAQFVIEVDGVCIGICGLSHFNWTSRVAELGITIGDKHYWGLGYGRETVELLLDYAFRYRNLRRVWLWVHGKNERAIRAYRGAGFVEEGRLREHVWSNGEFDDAVQMGVLRAEWAARQQS